MRIAETRERLICLDFDLSVPQQCDCKASLTPAPYHTWPNVTGPTYGAGVTLLFVGEYSWTYGYDALSVAAVCG